MKSLRTKEGGGMIARRQTLKGFMEDHLFFFLILMLACALANNLVTSIATAPFAGSAAASNLVKALCKFITALIPLVLMVRWNLIQKTSPRGLLTGFLLGSFSLLLIAENLLPFTLIGAASFKVQWLSVLAVIAANFGVGLMEEAGCRGVLLPMLCEKWSGRKNSLMKAALFSSLLFGCIHLSWLVNALVLHGTVSAAECAGRLYQVYYSFCFGMLCAGVTLRCKSFLPMAVWHSLVSLSAFIGQGILYPSAYHYYFELHPAGLDTVLAQIGVLRGAGPISWFFPVGLDALLLAAGIIMIQTTQRRAQP